MTRTRFVFLLIIGGVLSALAATRTQTPPAANRVDAAFQKFWAARSPLEADHSADEVLKSGATFDEAWRRLKQGRSYGPQTPGVVRTSHRINGIEHFYAVNVPQGYDPARRYQVRFQLHGGVGGRTSNQPRGTGEIGNLAGAGQIYVLPTSWAAAPWWSDDQVANLDAIVDQLKRTYNVDENHVVVAGVSDGGSGAFYIAMRSTTPYASFLPLNGFIMVLASDDIDDGGNLPNNLVNKPFFAVNGGKDPLYPTENVEPYLEYMAKHGVEMDYHPQPDAGHNTAWWPDVKDIFEKFVADHPRDPHPAKLSWEAVDLSHNRAHWLVLDQLGAQAGDATDLVDMNNARESYTLFTRKKSPGRVDVTRNGNAIDARTKGVAAFTLLLSPDAFDFSQPVKVTANGHVVFNGRVERSVKTLMKWAARDNDRTMLYGAEVKIKLAR